MIFVDAGAWVARHIQRDEHHDHAVKTWRWIKRDKVNLCTSNFVVGEVATLLARRVGSRFAAERVRRIYESSSICILRPQAADERTALDLMSRYADQRIGFTDCLSFILMDQHRVKRAFTFDRHFDISGFERWPQVIR